MNPLAPLPSASSRAALIDALNVAHWCGTPPSLRLPLTLLTALLSAGHEARLYFDASAPYRLRDEAGLYAELRLQSRYCIEVPSGRSADGALLRDARASGACLISRDHFGDYRRRYRKLIDDPSRLIQGWVKEGRLLLPALAVDVPLPVSTEAAWRLLQALL